MQSNLFFVPREERTGEIVQLVNRVNVGKSGGGFRSRGWENDEKLFLVRKNSCSKSPPAVAKPDRDITVPAKYYSIGTRNFLLYPGQVAESSESRVYFEWTRIATRRRNRKSLRNFPFRIIDYTACNYFEPFDYHSRISTSEDQSVWKNRWGWIEASQHVLYPSSPISIRSIE